MNLGPIGHLVDNWPWSGIFGVVFLLAFGYLVYALRAENRELRRIAREEREAHASLRQLLEARRAARSVKESLEEDHE